MMELYLKILLRIRKIFGYRTLKKCSYKAVEAGVPTLNEFFNLENVSKLKKFGKY